MLHWLKRHPIPVTAFFRRALVLTYAFPPQVLEPLVPKGLALDIWRGYGFLAIALVQTERMRPSFLPAAMGRAFFLSGYRIFTRLASGASLRGLRILRSETDRWLMASAGNLLTHYNYSLCESHVEERGGEIRWTVKTPHGDADLDVIARGIGPAAELSVALPASSPFRSMAEARRFAGPLPYTFDAEEETGSIVAIQAVRQRWKPTPVEVDVRRCTFLERKPFLSASPVLANAFYVHDVDYKWLRGRRVV
jgi:Uncharacterized conserved protein (COG2071)